MQIKRLSDGQKFEGPDGPVPDGFEAVKAAPQKQQMVEFPSMTGYIAGNIKRHPENVAAAAAAGIPGEGLAMGALRPLAAAGLSKAMGSDWEQAAKSAVETLTGTLIGGITRPIARTIGSALDKTVPQLTKLITRVLPEAAGSTPAETVNKIVGGEVRKEVGQQFGDMQKSLWDKYVNPNRLPGYVYPKELTDADKQLLNDSVQRLGTMAERAEWKAMNRKFYVAAGVEDWVKSAYEKGLIPGSGKFNVRALQETFTPARGKIADILPGVEGPLRMPVQSAQMDIAAKAPYVAAHMGMGLPHLRVGIPHAARLAEEGVTPELASQAARQLGVLGTGQALQSEENR